MQNKVNIDHASQNRVKVEITINLRWNLLIWLYKSYIILLKEKITGIFNTKS